MSIVHALLRRYPSRPAGRIHQARPLYALLGGLLLTSLLQTPSAAAPRFWPFPPARAANPHERAGYPNTIRPWAQPTDTYDYGHGYVGGGAFWRGEAGALDEGTWGRDYMGRFLQRRVWLDWWHGRRYQDGGGVYQTDGPHLRPKR